MKRMVPDVGSTNFGARTPADRGLAAPRLADKAQDLARGQVETTPRAPRAHVGRSSGSQSFRPPESP